MFVQIPDSCVDETYSANKHSLEEDAMISFESSMPHEPATEATGGYTKPRKQWNSKGEACLCVCRRHDSKLPPCRPTSEKVKAHL
jgi:hypothetical protein